VADGPSSYPHIPLSSYVPDGIHHYLNTSYPNLRAISKNPWIFLVDDLLTPSESSSMLQAARSSGAFPSAQLGGKGGATSDASHRRAHSKSFASNSSPLVVSLRQRVAQLLNLSADNKGLEVTQITRYEPGGFFMPHDDGIHSQYSEHAKRMCELPSTSPPFSVCNRVATIFVYLNDVPASAGGATAFPHAPLGDAATPLRVVPKAGRGIVFFPAKLSVSVDSDHGGLAERVLHESEILKEGEKWIVQLWLWGGNYIGPGS
jgi:hypothetical protein